MSNDGLLNGDVINNLLLPLNGVVLDTLNSNLLLSLNRYHLNTLNGDLFFSLYSDILSPLNRYLLLPLNGDPITLLHLNVVRNSLLNVISVLLGDVVNLLLRDDLTSLLRDVINSFLLNILSSHLWDRLSDSFINIVYLCLIPYLRDMLSNVLNGVIVLDLLLNSNVFNTGHRLILNVCLLKRHLLINRLPLYHLMGSTLLPSGLTDHGSLGNVGGLTSVVLGTDDPGGSHVGLRVSRVLNHTGRTHTGCTQLLNSTHLLLNSTHLLLVSTHLLLVSTRLLLVSTRLLVLDSSLMSMN